jgi:Bifunctional DNA primase/polymerase, N-terminal
MRSRLPTREYYAKEYLSLGLNPIPLRAQSKKASIKWQEYQTKMVSPAEIKSWFCDPDKNIGIVTGKISGLFVVDIDSEDAFQKILQLLPNRALPQTWISKTAKGYHLYFRYHDEILSKSAVRIAEGIDIRADGGYIVAPPSRHEKGVFYKWMENHSPADLPLGDIPEEILKFLSRQPQGGLSPATALPVSQMIGHPIKQGNRNEMLTRIFGFLLNNLPPYTAACLMYVVNKYYCEIPIPEEEVSNIIDSITKKEIRKHHQE